MIELLAKWFIKDRDNIENPAVRRRFGMLCGFAGIGFNVLLFCAKLFGGLISRSIAVTADAFNNLSDAASSVVTLAGFRIAGKKADREHPFGHGRFEYVAALIVSMLILLMGVELLRSAIAKIISPEPVSFSYLTAGILILSMLVKCYMAFYNRRIGRKIASAAMRATSLDSFSDMAATAAVLLSMIIGKWTGAMIDGWAGLAVALFILYTGFRSVQETISPLLGQPPSKEFKRRIEDIVLSAPEVVGVHDLVVHDYGPGRVIVSLHAEVPANGDILMLHDAVDNLERRLRDELGCMAVIHMDPVVTGDEHVDRYKAIVTEIVKAIDPCLSIHDFRYVPGTTHTNLVFDLLVPFGLSLTDEEIKNRVAEAVRALEGAYYAVVEIDRAYDGE